MNSGQFTEGNTIGKHFKEGNKGGGTPKGKRFATLLKQMLEVQISAKDVDGKEGPMQTDAAVMAALLRKALKEDTKAIEIIIEREDGKMEEKLDITHGEKLEIARMKLQKEREAE